MADFAPGGFCEPPAECQETAVSPDVVLYESVEEGVVAGVPLHELPWKFTTGGKG